MVKKVLVFLSATFFLIFVGLLVLYFYSHRSVNKENDIINFIPPQTDFVVRVKETSPTTNGFFAHSIVAQCLKMANLKKLWMAVDSVTSRNYKTAEILTKNTTYFCIDSTSSLILIDLNKKTNDHFIDQFLSNSTNHRKIEKFKEGYKAFYPQEGKPIFYFIKHNVMGISGYPGYLLSSLSNADSEKTDSLIMGWNDRSKAQISVWGRSGTEHSVLDSFAPPQMLFNGWIDKLSSSYYFDLHLDQNKIELTGELSIDSVKYKSYGLLPSQNQEVLSYQDTGEVTNWVYSVAGKDSLGKENNLIYTYHQFKDSANNNAQLLISNSTAIKYLFANAIRDTSVQLIPMADEQISKLAVMNRETVAKILPVIPVMPDTGKLFAVLYNDYFLVSNHTLTILQAVPFLQKSTFIKNSLEKGTVLSGSHKLSTGPQIQSDFSFRFRNGVMQVNCVLRPVKPN